MAMGAFLAGLLLSDSIYKHQIMAEIQPFSGLLLGFFYVHGYVTEPSGHLG